MELHTLATPTSLTLWWEKPEDAVRGETYEVLLSGQPSIETKVTHASFAHLAPEASLHAKVMRNHVLLGEADIVLPALPRKRLVTDFGAKGDGQTLNTVAIQAAIDALSPGDELVIPSGTFLTGALRLHSHMSLYLEEGAVLQGTERPEDYLPKIPSRFEGIEMMCFQSLLNLGYMDHTSPANCEDVLIHGPGTLSGGGQALALNIIASERVRLQAEIDALGDKIKEYENNNTIPGRARGRLINLSNCRNVRISGLTLRNGAAWNMHMLYSRGIVTDHCTFYSEGVWNGDGWDPDSSENCTLFGCTFHTGDDSVAIKSGKNPEGNVINLPTRHIRIFDCASEYGLGIAIGSEMSGGVEDVRIWDCDLEHSLYGVQIKGTKKRGGYVRDVHVSDSILSRFLTCAVLYNDDGDGSSVPPRFSDIHLKRVHLTGWARNYWEKEEHAMAAIDLSGFDVPGYEASDITCEECTLGKDTGISLSHTKNIRLDIAQHD